MRSGRSTLILVVVSLGLFAYIYFYESKRPADEGNPSAFTVEADAIEEMQIVDSKGESSTVRKHDDGWDLVEPAAAEADDTTADNLAQAVASLEIQRVVDENAADLAQYGLDDPHVDVGFRTAGATEPTHLLLGDKTPTGTEMYARTADSSRVFLISSYLESSFDKSPFDLRDKAILKFERDEVTGLRVSSPNGDVSLTKDGSDWALAEPLRATADFSTVEGLIGQIQSGRMTSLTATAPDDLAEYGLDRPMASATIVAGAADVTLEVGGPADEGGAYARDTSRPLVFTIPQTLVTAIEKSPSEYRRKDLFDFRSFNVSTLELTRDGSTLAFEKVPSEDSDEGGVGTETWRQTAPESKDVDRDALESVVAQLSALRIASYAPPGTPTGLDNPIAEVAVTFEDGARKEHVTFGRAGSSIYAARSGEPGAAVVDEDTFTSVMNGFDDFK